MYLICIINVIKWPNAYPEALFTFASGMELSENMEIKNGEATSTMKSYLSEIINRKRDLFVLLLIVIINLLIKSFPAWHLELGNDEVYYWTYALFPDWSHFDHPPMVGLMIQLFSLNLKFDNEFFLRAGSLLLSSASIIILYHLVKKLYSIRTAFIAVFIFISSFYFNIISGLLIMPDAPQVFFVLLSLLFLLPAVTNRKPSLNDNIRIIMFGIFTGMAFLSKYHSLFLWFGTGLYILIHNRVWIKKPSLYISIALTILLMIPVMYWNTLNKFISFTFHNERLGLFEKIDPLSFFQFNAGQIFYQNPVVFGIYVLTLISVFKNIKSGITQEKILLLYLFIPLVSVFTFISLFRTTLPHWTGPAYICMIILSSDYLDHVFAKGRKIVFRTVSAAIFLFLFILLAGTLQINTGIFNLDKLKNNDGRIGKNDFTLDMYGWKQLKGKFSGFLAAEGISENDHEQLVILSNNWYPAAHLDYYVASPLNIRLIVMGSLRNIHKYYLINKTRGLKKTDRVFYLTDSRNYSSPEKFIQYYSTIIPKDTVSIFRNGDIVKKVFIYEFTGFKFDSLPDLSAHVF